MKGAKFLMLTAVAIACASFLALSQPADARLIGMGTNKGHAASGVTAIRLSDDAMALAGFVVLVCSNHVACGH